MVTCEESKELSQDPSLKSLNSLEEQACEQYQSIKQDHLPKLKLTPSIGPYIMVNSS